MNYEEFYQASSCLKKKLDDAIRSYSGIQKALAKALESGDVKTARNLMAALAEVNRNQADLIGALADEINAFDDAAYFADGDFTAQLLEELGKQNIDVTGEAPVLEVFPYRVKISAEDREVLVDKKRYACMRPSRIAEIIKAGKEKLTKAGFKAGSFADELFEAYDTMCLKTGKNKKTKDLYLKDVYKFFAPARFRKEYDEQAFAFDIARLYGSGVSGTSGKGHYYEFGTSRNGSKAYRILDSAGKEIFVSTVRFDDR